EGLSEGRGLFVTRLPCTPRRGGPLSDSRSAQLIEDFRQHDSRGRFDEREVRERLRAVAEVPARVDVELLGVEPEGRRDLEEAFEEVARLLEFSHDCERGDHPKGA